MLPWQIKSTFIKSLSPFKMRCPAAICSDLRGVNSSLCIGHFCTKNAKLSPKRFMQLIDTSFDSML